MLLLSLLWPHVAALSSDCCLADLRSAGKVKCHFPAARHAQVRVHIVNSMQRPDLKHRSTLKSVHVFKSIQGLRASQGCIRPFEELSKAR